MSSIPPASGDAPNLPAVERSFRALQDAIVAALAADDGGRFGDETWERPEGGGGRTRVLTEGAVFEKAGVGFSHVSGKHLPPSASAHRPELAGASWEALGVSVVVHPRNPYAPISHMNVRFFSAGQTYWFGGG